MPTQWQVSDGKALCPKKDTKATLSLSLSLSALLPPSPLLPGLVSSVHLFFLQG